MAEHHPGEFLGIKTFQSGEELFFDVHDNFYDIIFLDIIMMTGKDEPELKPQRKL